MLNGRQYIVEQYASYVQAPCFIDRENTENTRMARYDTEKLQKTSS